jgi:carbamoyltransferase
VTAILGISAFYHDSAAALIVDGEIIAAAQEERFTRKKHDPGFPAQAVQYCLNQAGLTEADLDYVAFYEKPLLKFERLLETYLAFAPRGFASFVKAIPVWLKEKLFQRRSLRESFPGASRAKLVFTEHHESHAASAFFPSPFEEAAIVTLDGVGEWCTTSLGVGRGRTIQLTRELHFPHSLGLLYSAATYHCGFKVNSGEYKLMGLAPFGRPVYADVIRKHMLEIRPDGSFRMQMRYFDYCHGLTMTNRHFSRLIGFEPRSPESDLQQCHCDLAASIQQVTEELVLLICEELHRQTQLPNLVMAGGVALNCVANGRLLREGPFRNLWVQPAAGDAGGALGTAMFVWHQLLENPRQASSKDSMKGSLLGPEFSTQDIVRLLRSNRIPFEQYDEPSQLNGTVARMLSKGLVVGWFQGRMEFGPRALGARSILADARAPDMQSRLNQKIKFRESFRPFAPVVLREHASELFEVRPDVESPYMLLVANVAAEHRRTLSEEERAVLENSPNLIDRIRIQRSSIPAVTHVDHSARIQTIDPERHSRMHHLLTSFHELTGCPVLVNTSFNVRGEPIVCRPEQALECFLVTEMDVLVMENCVIERSRLPPEVISSSRRQEHLSQFAPD